MSWQVGDLAVFVDDTGSKHKVRCGHAPIEIGQVCNVIAVFVIGGTTRLQIAEWPDQYRIGLFAWRFRKIAPRKKTTHKEKEKELVS